MVDGRATDKVSVKTTPTPELSDVTTRFHDDLELTRRIAADRTLEQVPTFSSGQPDNPYQHIISAGQALQELEALKGKDANQTIQVQDTNGQQRQVTVAQRQQELVQAANQQFQLAVQTADVLTAQDLTAYQTGQPNVYQALQDIRVAEGRATNFADLLDLKRQESMLDARKHASSVTRAVYAEFLADAGDLVGAQNLYSQAASIDKEARYDDQFKALFSQVEQQLRAKQETVVPGANPMAALDAAQQALNAGNAAAAEASFKQAIAQADQLDPRQISSTLTKVQRLEQQYANNPSTLGELKDYEQGLQSLQHAGAVARLSYAEFLISQGRSSEAQPLLARVAQLDPQFVAEHKADVQKLQDAASGQQQAASSQTFDDPFQHLQKADDAMKHGKIKDAQKEAEAAVAAAQKIDRQGLQKQINAVNQQISQETDPQKKTALQQQATALDQYEHSLSYAKMTLAAVEISQHNYNSARQALDEVKRDDPDLLKRKAIEPMFSKLYSDSQAPSTWDKIWGFAKNVLKEAACDAVAIVAAAGVVAATSLTGPGALIAGGATGAAVYTGMKTLVFGDKFRWDMPLWGVLDGVTGGGAALARGAIVAGGERVVSTELSARLLAKTGAETAGLEGIDGGLTAARTAQDLARVRLAEVGKDTGFWTRQVSKIPLINAGSDTYRSAYYGYKGLQALNLATSFGVNSLTAGAGSLIYRGGHDAVNYYQGRYNGLGDFARSYAGDVTRDTLTGGVLGTAGEHMISGLGTTAGRIPGASSLAGRFPNLGDQLGTTFTVGSPMLYQWLAANEQLKQLGAERQAVLGPATDVTQEQYDYMQLPKVIDPSTDLPGQDVGQPTDPSQDPNQGQ